MSLKKELDLKAPGIHRGFFITIEGLDGAGKSTQVELLACALRKIGLAPLTTKEPTAGPWGQKIRLQTSPGLTAEEELDYFVRDRDEDVSRFGPELLAGRPVVADRYILSNVAYQTARGVAEGRVRKANQNFPKPDLTVILEIPVEEGLKRIARSREGGLDRVFEEENFLKRVQTVFQRQNSPEILRLNGLAPPERITELIMEELRARDLVFVVPKPSFIDSHCHLSSSDYKEDLGQVLQRAEQAGVNTMLNVGLGPENSRQVLALAERYPHLRPVVGWHPHEADDLNESGLQEIIGLAQDPRVVGFGEIGLDFALMHSSRANQLRAFESFLEAATSLNLPVVIHTREAFEETLFLLKKYTPHLKKGGVIHCFNRSWDEAQAFLDLNFYLSIPGSLTYPKSTDLALAVPLIPENRLLVETDAPYLTPVPLRGHRNEPGYVVWTLIHLARLRKTGVAEMAALTTANTRRLFDLGGEKA